MENNNLEKVEKEYWGKSFYGSKLNTVLLLILIVLMIFALRFMYQNQGKYLPDFGNDKLKNTEQNEIQINNNSNNQEKNELEWVKSQTFGLYYPESFNPPSEFYRKNGTEIVYESSGNTIPVFSLIFNDGKSVITWGDVWKGGYIPGTCTQSDFGIFEYGASSVACVKGYRTWVAHFSARDTVTVDDLKIFGDFVLKNK